MVANAMPEVYFISNMMAKDLKQQYKLRNSIESEGQVLDSAIH